MENDMQSRSDAEAREKVYELIADIGVAQLVTVEETGRMRSRPMVAQLTNERDVLWFFTSANTGKVDEIEAHREVMLTYSHPSKQHYVAVRGNAEIIDDKAKVQELWSEPVRTWFPNGPDDSDIALIKVSIKDADYWDSPSSTLVYVYGYAKAVLTGQRPSGGENEHVDFRSHQS